MHIRLGLQLDGQRGDLVHSELDALTTGPLGFLNIIETQLGLLRLEPSTSDRILQFREILARLDGPNRFYHRSFAVDALGTAATLLAWCDLWHLHGWSTEAGTALAASPSRRMRDMAALLVETEDTHKLAAGVGKRLAMVKSAMAVTRPRIERLILCEPLSHWPPAWQQVLCELQPIEQSGMCPAAQEGTLLGDIQRALLSQDGGTQAAQLRWRDDGSVSVMQAETGWLAAQSLAHHLVDKATDTVLCAPQIGVLDEVMAAAQLPRQGFKEPNGFRPALQVLPLVLGQLWKPLDLYGLLQFLTHPICPLPWVARSRLAEMVARSPGIGQGPAWDRALADIETACAASGKDWTEVRERIRQWLEQERHDPVQGAPLAVVTERLNALAQYFQGRLRDTDPAKQIAFTSGLSQTLTLLRALKALALQGETHIAAQPLQTLLAQATAQGTIHPLLVAQVGACRTVTHPGAVVDEAEQVVWWQLQAPPDLAGYPWSRAELAELQRAGVALPPLDDVLARDARAWQAPVLAARRRLVLVLPPTGAEMHPLWLLLESLFEKGHGPAIQAMEDNLTDTRLAPVAYRPLPPRQRWWQLPPEADIPRRKSESFSSLESFLFNPFQWVLKYPAALNTSSILDVSEGVLLYGNLSHHLVERYVVEPFALTQADSAFDAWFDAAFETLISQEGAVLQMPGRQEELASFQRKLRKAMHQLRSQWRAAKVVSVRSEERLEGQFVGGNISGYGDLLVVREDGEQAIIDMKWGGKAYADMLANNRHLQLAIYGEIVRQRTGQWPRLAYFSFSTGELLATDRDYFPEARLVRKKDEVADEGAAHLWQRFLVTWAWRRGQIDQGLIEVVLDEEGDTEPPEEGLVLEVLNTRYNDYLKLAGWGDEQ